MFIYKLFFYQTCFVVASGCVPLVLYIQSIYTSMHAIHCSNNGTIVNTEPLRFYQVMFQLTIQAMITADR
jgi:hypothetical protein